MSIKGILSVSAAVSAAVLVSCGGSKSAATPPLSQEKQEIQKSQSLEDQKALAVTDTRQEKDMRVISIPCSKESIDGSGFVAGLGISKPQDDRRTAEMEANQVALNDIASRIIGFMTGLVDHYNKSGQVSSVKEIEQNGLNGKAFAQTVVDKYAQSTCLELMSKSDGTYIAYQAVKISTSDLSRAMATQLGQLGEELPDIDKKAFLETLKVDIERQQEEGER